MLTVGNKQDMRHYLNDSISNFDYVLTHTQEDYVMRGEVHVGKARALKLAGKKGEAAAEYIKALRYNPNSSAIYLALADYYQETGNKPKALEMVTEGLRRNPDSKGLKLRYTELGGKRPYPEPVKPEQPATASPVESSQTSTSPAAAPRDPTSPAGEQKSPEIPPAGGTSPAMKAAHQASSGTSSGAPIGSPSNPWCRFCP